MKYAFIALGSNIEDREKNLKTAVAALGSVPGIKVVAASPIYQTKPVGYIYQSDFYNAVVKVVTRLSPEALFGVCLGIESGMGRVRTIKNGPRIIDLDLLLYEGYTCCTDFLILPHPRMKERAFVLKPLCEIFDSEEYRTALENLDTNDIIPVGEIEIL
ncbi:MAG TPA: 2-amino-4-hydroxy-6-hydroxymethyldihydropteridine diphosphokinase [Clostridiales bacterium]|nr:2-amino-4-hydroxy-6-hydroxymethyldihydropteridine diphosphokinase [Clostridiales bacterium]